MAEPSSGGFEVAGGPDSHRLAIQTISVGCPRWIRACGWSAIVATLPTILWRAVVGLGLDLGTPASWRQTQHITGSGTIYVLTLSGLQLAAALLTLVLIRPHGDRLPPWNHGGGSRRLPLRFVVGCSGAGIATLSFLCVASAAHRSNVDPFRGAQPTYWSWLCWACYTAAPPWPVLLTATTVGYTRARRREAMTQVAGVPVPEVLSPPEPPHHARDTPPTPG